MPRFSKTSLSKLETCHPVLQDLMHEVIRFFDIKVIEGYRSNERQESLYFAGKSKIKNNGKHNRTKGGQPCSEAVDILFCPFVRGDWERKDKFERMAGYVLATFDQMQSDGRISSDWVLVSGSDWDDDITTDQWFDGPHFEVREKK